jgi:hypothetical protein
MKSIMTISIILLYHLTCHSQSEKNAQTIDRHINKYVIGFIPSQANNIYGIALGPIGSEAICNRPYTKYSYGLNLQIPGQGFLQVFYIFNTSYKLVYSDYKFKKKAITEDTILKRVIHTGLAISLLGTFSNEINGVSISGWMSMGNRINGVSANLVWNLYRRIDGVTFGLVNTVFDMRGVQLGLINKSISLRGIQIGFWNKNGKRSLPILNWNFK